jgi:hemolysin-activating ACP:hemolysin acyltransferase
MNDKPKAAAKPAAKAAAAPQPAKAMANANAAQAQRAAALSNIVALMIRDPKFRVMKIADLEWLVMPAIVSGQWQLAQGTTPAGEKKPGARLSPAACSRSPRHSGLASPPPSMRASRRTSTSR